MQKCEHNLKITHFCISDHCIWREAGGCIECIKKYHNHHDSTCIAEEKQIVKLLIKLTPQSYCKPDFKILEEQIQNYFAAVKEEANNFIDALSKKILNEFRFSYFTKQELFDTFEKIKSRDYRKITQKQFKKFYDKVNNMNGSVFKNEQKKSYLQNVRKHSSIFDSIFETFHNLESLSKKFESIVPIKIDKNIENKIKSTLESIDHINKTLEAKSPVNEKQDIPNQIVQSKQQPNIQAASLSSEEPQNTFPEINQQKQQNIIKPKYQKNNQIHHQNKNQYQISFIKKYKQDGKKTPIERQQHQVVNQQYRIIQPTSANSENIDKKNIEELSKESSIITQKNNLLTPQKSKFATNNISISVLNQVLSDHAILLQNSELPSKVIETPPKHSLITHKIKKRSIVIPVKGNTTIQPDDSSPILKRKKQIEKFTLSLKPIQEKDQQNKQFTEFAQKITFTPAEQKSISLLNQSLSCKPLEAISLLQKAVQLSANNLSAAQYLSFLLLEQQKPLQVLSVCNKLLENLKGEIIYDINTLHIHNNKAAALIMMGRYSQAIPLLQTCIRIKQGDRFYKNLGDAYFSIGISEKAIYNYQRSVQLNNNYGQAFYNLAACFYTTGNYNEARVYISRAIKINPENPQYMQLDKELKQKI